MPFALDGTSNSNIIADYQNGTPSPCSLAILSGACGNVRPKATAMVATEGAWWRPKTNCSPPVAPPSLCNTKLVMLPPSVVEATQILTFLFRLVLELPVVRDEVPHDAAAVRPDPPSCSILQVRPCGYIITPFTVMDIRLACADLKCPAMKATAEKGWHANPARANVIR